MKSIFLTLIIFCTVLVSTAQSNRSIRQDDIILSFGLNTVNSLGTKNPFENPSDWAFRTPFSLGFETKWTELFSFEILLSLNGFKTDSKIDGGSPSKNLTYFSADSSIKYYFGKYIFPEIEWIDFYGNAGLGLFTIDTANLSFNFGGGAVFWFNNQNRIGSFGLKVQGIGKFAVNHNSQIYANNHFQYTLALIYKL